MSIFMFTVPGFGLGAQGDEKAPRCPKPLRSCRQQERDRQQRVACRAGLMWGHRCCGAEETENGPSRVLMASGSCSPGKVSLLSCGPEQLFVTHPETGSPWDVQAKT